MSDSRLPPNQPIEKHAGAPDVAPADASLVDRRRKEAYMSYEHFLFAHLRELDAQRPDHWHRNYTSVDAYLQSVEPMRARLKAMLGFWRDPRDRPAVQHEQLETICETDAFIATRVALEVVAASGSTPALTTYAIELRPKSEGPHPALVAQHGYGATPELVTGFAATSNNPDYAYRSLGMRAVQRGFHVIAVAHPFGYGTLDDTTRRVGDRLPRQQDGYGPNRLHRLAELAGGTLFGMHMLATSRAIDLLETRANVDKNRIGMYGLSHGGQSALYLPALDTRIRSSVSSAYFNDRLPKLIGPCATTPYIDWIDECQFFPDYVRHFSDVDIASLIAPRAFAIEAGRLDTSVGFDDALRAYEQAREPYEKLGVPERIEFIPHAEGHVSATARAFEFLVEQLSNETSR